MTSNKNKDSKKYVMDITSSAKLYALIETWNFSSGPKARQALTPLFPPILICD
jgi:hypothetical protein